MQVQTLALDQSTSDISLESRSAALDSDRMAFENPSGFQTVYV